MLKPARIPLQMGALTITNSRWRISCADGPQSTSGFVLSEGRLVAESAKLRELWSWYITLLKRRSRSWRALIPTVSRSLARRPVDCISEMLPAAGSGRTPSMGAFTFTERSVFDPRVHM